MRAFTSVRIVGLSMEPTVVNGDWWLVRRSSRLRPGAVVLLRHPLRPELPVVKRLVERRAEGWWVLGDNPDHSEDSRQFGTVPEELIVGRLILRYRPLLRG